MDDETETLIRRASQMHAYGMPDREIVDQLVDEGVEPDQAFLAARAGRVFAAGRGENPMAMRWTRFSNPMAT